MTHHTLRLLTCCICITMVGACGPDEHDDALDEDDASSLRSEAPDMNATDMRTTDMRTTDQPDMSDMRSSYDMPGDLSDTAPIDMQRTDMSATEDMSPATSCDPQDPTCIDSFPHLIVDTTVGGDMTWSSYACSPDTNEGGPERTYRVLLEEAGFLSAKLAMGPDDVDIDIHLLSREDASACIDRGHLTSGALLEPGEYWIVADSWVDDQGKTYAGDFELSLNLTRPQDLLAHGISAEVARDALTAFGRAWGRDETRKLEYAVTDFSMHSRHPRAWVMDLSSGELLFLLTIGHGEGSVQGDDMGVASVFSNVPQSHTSSLGMMRAAETYTGDFGYSMRLDGLEPGFNDKVRQRDIVVHPDERNRPDVTARQGWLTPSWGCPSLDPATSMQVVDTLSGGALMFFWYPDQAWRSSSALLQ